MQLMSVVMQIPKMNRLDILPSFLCPLNNDKRNSLLTRKPGIVAPSITLGFTLIGEG